MNPRFRTAVRASAPALALALCVPPTLARELTEQNRAELANVPPTWQHARLCFHEGGGLGGPRVVVGLETTGANTQVFAVRPEKPNARLPGYLMNRTDDLADRETRVAAVPGVGYNDVHREVFVMPSGARLACESLPTDAAPGPRR